MMSLVSILWQLQIKKLKICQTILKNYRQEPKYYFFSSKQERVLRKKSPNISQLLQQHHNKKCLFFYIKRNIQKQISLQFVQINQALELICDSQKQFQLALLDSMQNQERSRILRIIYDQTMEKKSKNSLSVEVLMGQRINSQILELIRIYCQENVTKISKNIAQIQKKPSNKIISVDFIVLFKENGEILMIDALKILPAKPFNVILAPNYSPITKKKQFFVKKIDKQKEKKQENPHIFKNTLFKSQNQCLKFDSQQNQKHQQKETAKDTPQKYKSNIIPQIQTIKKQNISIQCKCCQNQAYQWKEIAVQQIREWKRLNGKSIRGLFEQFYPICLDCYSQI